MSDLISWLVNVMEVAFLVISIVGVLPLLVVGVFLMWRELLT